MSRDVDIDFLGVFDTVASVGAVFPRALPFSTQNGKTRVFRHALALDEHRAKFRQETWHYVLPEKTFSLTDSAWTLATLPFQVLFFVLGVLSGSSAQAQENFKNALEKRIGAPEPTRQANIKEVSVSGALLSRHYQSGLIPNTSIYLGLVCWRSLW